MYYLKLRKEKNVPFLYFFFYCPLIQRQANRDKYMNSFVQWNNVTYLTRWRRDGVITWGVIKDVVLKPWAVCMRSLLPQPHWCLKIWTHWSKARNKHMMSSQTSWTRVIKCKNKNAMKINDSVPHYSITITVSFLHLNTKHELFPLNFLKTCPLGGFSVHSQAYRDPWCLERPFRRPLFHAYKYVKKKKKKYHRLSGDF